jgi:hypothetical protein
MAKMNEQTRTCNAHFYLDDAGGELSREKFLEELISFDQDGYMLYVGAGFMPLRVAVAALSEDDAADIFEDWCRKTGREDEINETEDVPEDEWGVYDYTVERIPQPRVVMPVEVKWDASKNLQPTSMK